MITIDLLKFTRYLDVKCPVGLVQRGENLGNYNIGMDLYMPKNTEDFHQAILKANEKVYPGIYISDYEVENCKYLKFCDDDDNLILEIIKNNIDEVTYNIYKPIQIPTGIGVLIPENVWGEIRSKSSNFSIGFDQKHGTIDMNYTYGMGVQIDPVLGKTVVLQPDQKFSQLVFHEAVPILETLEIPLNEWDQMTEVIDRRTIRKGGFGSTKKFDK